MKKHIKTSDFFHFLKIGRFFGFNNLFPEEKAYYLSAKIFFKNAPV